MYLNSELCLVRSLQPLAQPRQLEVNVPHAGRVLADVVHKAALKAHADVVLEKVAEAPGLLGTNISACSQVTICNHHKCCDRAYSSIQ